MAQSNNISYAWHAKEQRYAASYYDYTVSQWKFWQWMNPGWQPQSQQPNPPSTPQSGRAYDSAYGTSPFISPKQSSSHYIDSPSAANYSRYQQPFSHSHVRPFPKGEGATIQGHYDAMQGAKPGNLHYEEEDQSFYVRDRKFFQEGKVFAVIFSEPAGETATNYNSALSTQRYPGHKRHTQTRRFVVVRAKREFCFACPVFTYSGRATTKRGVRAEEHGIIYSDGQSPTLVTGETGIKKPSIAVAMAEHQPPLQAESRIYYGIHHPIQYNVKVKDIGHVLPHHIPTLIGNWKAEDENESRQAPEVTAAAEEADLPNVPEGEEEEQSIAHNKAWGKKPATDEQSIPQSPTSYRDPHLYHSKKNVHGYDPHDNPHMYHPEHNQHGFHPQHNQHGYHPVSNPYSYHPEHNPHGHHPQLASFCFHPAFNTYGYHGQKNPGGYHPSFTPLNYDPNANVYGYHPEYNEYGYHPEQNPSGYHPTHNPAAYHPHWRPDGFREEQDDSDDNNAEDKVSHDGGKSQKRNAFEEDVELEHILADIRDDIRKYELEDSDRHDSGDKDIPRAIQHGLDVEKGAHEKEKLASEDKKTKRDGHRDDVESEEDDLEREGGESSLPEEDEREGVDRKGSKGGRADCREDDVANPDSQDETTGSDMYDEPSVLGGEGSQNNKDSAREQIDKVARI